MSNSAAADIESRQNNTAAANAAGISKPQGLTVRFAWFLISSFALGMATAAEVMSEKLAAETSFDIAAQPLRTALKELADQAGIQILFEEQVVQGHEAAAVRAHQSAAQALDALLKNTDLEFTAQGETVAVRRKTPKSPTSNSPAPGLRLSSATDSAGPAPEEKGVRWRIAQNGAEERTSGPTNVPAGTRQLEIEEILVTGSRIAREVGEELLPTTTINQKFIDDRGYYSIGEALADVPLFSLTSNTDTDFSQSLADVGFTFVDLFGLGSQRTLTLVNGKRVPSSASPTGGRRVGSSGLQVDLNAIPSAMVDRIETVTVGGAPVYGADAIAGTVNVILKDQFTGWDFDAQYGLTDQGDADNYRVRGLYGLNFAGERGNFALAVEYSHRDALRFTDRPGANDNQVPPAVLDPAGPVLTFQTDLGFPGLSAYGVPTSSATFVAGVLPGDVPLGFAQSGSGQTLVFNQAGELVPIALGNANGTFALTQNQPDFPGLLRLGDYIALLNESRRLTLSTFGHFDISRAVRATLRVNYSDLDARQPVGFPVFRFADLQTSVNNPFLSAASRSTLLGATTAGIPIPFILDPAGNFFLGKTLNEISTDGGRTSSQNWSAVAGLEGEIEARNRTLKWDLSYSRGAVDTDNTLTGVLTSNFNAAADAVMVDGSGAIIANSSSYAPLSSFTFNAAAGGYVNASAGQSIVCRARTVSSTSTCLPFNIFGANNPDAVIDYVSSESLLRTKIDQQYVQGNLNGEIFDLPAGPLGLGIGAEWREEKSLAVADADTTAGAFTQIVPTPKVAGKFTSKEYYTETIVPLLSGEMMKRAFGHEIIKSLQFEGAFRILDNSQAGTDHAWTAGGRLRFNDSLMLRGNKTRSVRAPSITEAFSGVTQEVRGFPDPCRTGVIGTGPNPAQRRANCVADVIARGLAANASSAETFLASYTGQVLSITGTSGGNENLDNEVADAWTVGLVVTPSFLPNFTAAFDWTDIRIEQAIQNRTGSDLVADCYDNSGFPGAACGQFDRNASTFFITDFRGGFINLGFLDFAALTSNLRYSFGLGAGGRLGQMSLANTLIYLERYDSSVNGVLVEDSVDLIGQEKLRDQLALSYANGPFTAIWAANYAKSAFIGAEDRDGTADLFEFDHTRTLTTHNLSLLYDFNKQLRVRLIVNNLFEQEQPIQLRQIGNVNARLDRSFFLGIAAQL